MDTSLLEKYGWKDFFAQQYLPHAEGAFVPARVSAEHRGSFLVLTAGGEIPAEVTGRMMFQAEDRLDYPVVGDWVLVHLLDKETHAVIHSVLTRRTLLLRKTAGKDVTAQTIAANIDIGSLSPDYGTTSGVRTISCRGPEWREAGRIWNKCDLARMLQDGFARLAVVTCLVSRDARRARHDDLEPPRPVTSAFRHRRKIHAQNRLADGMVRTAEVRKIDFEAAYHDPSPDVRLRRDD
jgi:hypothetical protein